MKDSEESDIRCSFQLDEPQSQAFCIDFRLWKIHFLQKKSKPWAHFKLIYQTSLSGLLSFSDI